VVEEHLICINIFAAHIFSDKIKSSCIRIIKQLLDIFIDVKL
jgi:hypothetical protein